MKALARFLFWDYRRGSWQYDIMVALILAFIFLTPRYVFQDQPKPATVQMLPGEGGTGLFWIAPELLNGVPEGERVSRASNLVHNRFKTHEPITRVEPLLDDEKEITGYMAYARQ